MIAVPNKYIHRNFCRGKKKKTKKMKKKKKKKGEGEKGRRWRITGSWIGNGWDGSRRCAFTLTIIWLTWPPCLIESTNHIFHFHHVITTSFLFLLFIFLFPTTIHQLWLPHVISWIIFATSTSTSILYFICFITLTYAISEIRIPWNILILLNSKLRISSSN